MKLLFGVLTLATCGGSLQLAAQSKPTVTVHISGLVAFRQASGDGPVEAYFPCADTSKQEALRKALTGSGGDERPKRFFPPTELEEHHLALRIPASHLSSGVSANDLASLYPTTDSGTDGAARPPCEPVELSFGLTRENPRFEAFKTLPAVPSPDLTIDAAFDFTNGAQHSVVRFGKGWTLTPVFSSTDTIGRAWRRSDEESCGGDCRCVYNNAICIAEGEGGGSAVDGVVATASLDSPAIILKGKGQPRTIPLAPVGKNREVHIWLSNSTASDLRLSKEHARHEHSGHVEHGKLIALAATGHVDWRRFPFWMVNPPKDNRSPAGGKFCTTAVRFSK